MADLLVYADGCVEEHDRDCPNNARRIPDGKTCGDCAHASKCTWFLGRSYNAASKLCDWYPVRFALASGATSGPAGGGT